MATSAGDLVHFLAGFSVGYSAPSLPQMISDQILTSSLSSWFASALIVAQVVGAIAGPSLADRIGRRNVFLLLCPVSALGWVVLATSKSTIQLFVGRTLHGLVEAMMSPVSIMFMSEVTEVRYRGMFLNTSTVLAGCGITMAYIAGALLHWRYSPVLPVIVNILAIVMFLWLRKSPLYLITRQDASAYDALAWYRETKGRNNEVEIEEEMKEITTPSTGCHQKFIDTLKYLKKKDNRKPFLIAFALFFLYPLTGVYSITFFAISLFHTLGLGSEHAVAITSAVVRVLGSVLSSILIYSTGRRSILIVSSALSTLSIALTGALVFLRGEFSPYLSWILMILVFVYMFNMGLGVVSIPWVLMGEWFTVETKSLVSGVLITTQFITMFMCVQLTEVIKESIGVPGLFFVFGVNCLVYTVFVFIFVPETHGRLFTLRNVNKEMCDVQNVNREICSPVATGT